MVPNVGLIACLINRILDTDYLEFLDDVPNAPDIILTDEHDVEIMLIRSPAFDRLLAEMGSAPKLQALRAKGLDLRQMIRDAGHDLGVLRFLSLAKPLDLTFRKIHYRFVDRSTLAVDVSEMIDEVYNSSQRKCSNKSAIVQEIADQKTAAYDPWRMCCGHDLTAILGKALLSVFGTNSTQVTRVAEIESRLRMAFSMQDLRATKLFEAVVAWERANVPYLIWASAVRIVS
jgi:hypothetical protein